MASNPNPAKNTALVPVNNKTNMKTKAPNGKKSSGQSMKKAKGYC